MFVLQASWFEAQTACCSIGMTLLVLNSAQKYFWMDSIKNSAKASVFPSTGVENL